VRVGGITRAARLAPLAEPPTIPLCLYPAAPGTVDAYWTQAGGLALDVGGWLHSVSERVAAGDVVAAERTRIAVTELRRTTSGIEGRTSRRRVTPTGMRGQAGQGGWVRAGEPGTDVPATQIQPP
jgi:hypothetical protein